MKVKISLLAFTLSIVLLISGCLANTSTVKSPLKQNTNTEANTNQNVSYESFINRVQLIKKSLATGGFDLITKGDKLNRQFTSFPDNQKLDSRLFDGVKGNSNLPSRYEFYFLNKEKTVLVRMNLIYCPEFNSTKIIALTSHIPGQLPYVGEEHQKITEINYTTYLIAFKGGIAQVDFMLVNNARAKGIKDSKKYLIEEGEKKFLPTLEKSLLSV